MGGTEGSRALVPWAIMAGATAKAARRSKEAEREKRIGWKSLA
jgi:hypothetical protein